MSEPPVIVDAHEDLAWNMLTFGRDYTMPVEETRRREKDSYIVKACGDTTISWQEHQRGRIALVFNTLCAIPARVKPVNWLTQAYATADEAHKLYNNQLDVYDRLFEQHPDKFVPVRSIRQLDAAIGKWTPPGNAAPTGLVTLMEGAECVRAMDELGRWWDRGVRIIGPAWVSTRFCGGTGEPGPLTPEGRDLLGAMAPRGFALDLTHMAWESAMQAIDLYQGPILASHSNALNKVRNGTSNRFLTDEIMEGIVRRNGVIGIVPFVGHLIQRLQGRISRDDCPLAMVADQIDYVCQKTGNARHAGFGSDFDGGFGLQHIPPEMDTVADLQKLAPVLAARGYSGEDIAAIFGGNWINLLRASLPA